MFFHLFSVNNIWNEFVELDKSSADVAAEGAILNEMLEIVAKRASLRPNASQMDLTAAGTASSSTDAGITLTGHSHEQEESNVSSKPPLFIQL